MKKVIADKWVKALRSKKYKQGEGQLRTGKNEFCCLGVLCNLHAQEHPKFAATQTDAGLYDDQNSFPSKLVQKWAGLKNSCGDFNSPDGSLVDMNDGGNNFLEIAEVIEKNWRKL